MNWQHVIIFLKTVVYNFITAKMIIEIESVKNQYLWGLVCLNKAVKLWVVAGYGDSQDGSQHPRCKLGLLLRRNVLLHLPSQLEVLEDGSCMEQLVARLPKHQGQLLVVIGHHLGL